jgi:hypothetical protein
MHIMHPALGTWHFPRLYRVCVSHEILPRFIRKVFSSRDFSAVLFAVQSTRDDSYSVNPAALVTTGESVTTIYLA